MKRTFEVLTVILLLPLTGLTGSIARAQQPPIPLAELARQQRELRRQSPRSGETITTEVASALRPGSRLSIAGVPATQEGPAAAGETTPGAPTPEGEAAEGETTGLAENSEEAWRAAFAEARAEIGRLENQIELHQQELTDLNNQLLTRDDVFNREGQLTPQITAKQDEITQAMEELVAATEVLNQLQTDLRRAGLPAGWAR